MPKSANGYIIFYSFYKKILDEEFPKLSPKEKAVKAGEIWNSSSNDFKNSFILYADNQRIIKSIASQTQQPVILPQYNSMDELKIIFDDNCRNNRKIANNNHLNKNHENISPASHKNEDNRIADEMFKLYINEDAFQ
ncbi:hypothetical protein RhiirA5_413657 [Rhizophagus irregularis]|uniref:HMG box domain-containing protein n=3 Tax=Rhizophagus irregularis TaxID=588596 RepID=A0A2I1GYA5_9GLOM|nr:hypothetical protein GLOIN_2v1773919 [Rhizophagus irregularis DAOM 181602=DAOM 197198]EXX64865.1 hypothetical protein RirG_138740 [Rhizophagus irregularis DAOM 197198w]PKC10998.1 hypothetical protein RhiirA5_413657 [Rhizophagus irregularis]PKY51616.1 hypothetical protein RhiirA4_424652 [Rhizophagus irregularis]POG72254.1 hypothetical protein GLOIN_2v1773919 [Rhizophagus irregularis DAOM 181602=DAOM 197198]UZO00650.1 hypothetical protein OCT59_011772 [Rhizophagus irregularis]|eukprot:XP_025179120.1 hypothetical protein GLOIN_2v1773919 [Rhizophagus irregularis DAOM 181602=DAOM 197198]